MNGTGLRNIVAVAALAGLISGLMAGQAAAWGPEAQRVITSTAVVQIRDKFPNVFKTQQRDYYDDVMQGAVDGPSVLREGEFSSRRDAIGSIRKQIQLLREVYQGGTGSYFAYRMGVLSALVSDMLLPYALDTSPEGSELREAMEADIDEHVRNYVIQPFTDRPNFISAPDLYFNRLARFDASSHEMIAGDYQTGTGYDGFLSQAAPKYLQDATVAVIDVWNTVLTIDARNGYVPPAGESLTWYRVDEIAYLLETKENPAEAKRVYPKFTAVNPGIPRAYEAVGDLFYEFGDHSEGVRQWAIALDMAGPSRERIEDKLAGHFIEAGQEALAKAEDDPANRDSQYEAANQAFSRALSYDRANQQAVQLLTQTNNRIRERENAREATIRLMSAAEEVQQKAQQDVDAGNYGKAITTYRTATNILQEVAKTDAFPDQQQSAQDTIDSIERTINDIINDILTEADRTIAEGDNALDQREFDQAISHYERVEGIVSHIPDDREAFAQEKQELVEQAEQKIADAKVKKRQWEEQQQQMEQGGGGGQQPAA